MKKEIKCCGVILLSIVIISLLAGHVIAQDIIIDTEKGERGFWTENPSETSLRTAVRDGFVKPLVRISSVLVR